MAKLTWQLSSFWPGHLCPGPGRLHRGKTYLGGECRPGPWGQLHYRCDKRECAEEGGATIEAWRGSMGSEAGLGFCFCSGLLPHKTEPGGAAPASEGVSWLWGGLGDLYQCCNSRANLYLHRLLYPKSLSLLWALGTRIQFLSEFLRWLSRIVREDCINATLGTAWKIRTRNACFKYYESPILAGEKISQMAFNVLIKSFPGHSVG